MTATDAARSSAQPAARIFAGLAGDLHGSPDHRSPLVLLHGLTFNRTTWGPALAALQVIDPRRQVLALDLPGHGQSPSWPSYSLDRVTQGVHRAVQDAGLLPPVVAGHSYSAVVATLYAARYPARGVVNVDQPLQVEPFAQLVRSLATQLRGPGFPAAWQMFEASMQLELLPAPAQELARSACDPRQDLVTGYWREALDDQPEDLAGRAETALAALRARQIPYLLIAGHELEPGYRDWLAAKLPQADVAVWPASGHFPHLAHQARFADCLAATARWRGGPSVVSPAAQPGPGRP